jgi:RNA polymerase sigma-70 factor (ECF subfamily)
VRDAAREPDADLVEQRRLVDAFLAAARGGDFDALLAVLDPDVLVRVDRGALRPAATREIHGARAVADQARKGARLARFARPALVNGAAGLVLSARGRPLAVAGFTIVGGRIVEIDVFADRERLRGLDLDVLDG